MAGVYAFFLPGLESITVRTAPSWETFNVP
jgi:hypothetical protein